MDEVAQKIMYKIRTIRNNNDAIWVHISLYTERYCSFFSKILVIVLSQILLHGIVQNFPCDMPSLNDDIVIIFEHNLIGGDISHIFSRIFRKMQILCSIERNRAKNYMQDIYY